MFDFIKLCWIVLRRTWIFIQYHWTFWRISDYRNRGFFSSLISWRIVTWTRYFTICAEVFSFSFSKFYRVYLFFYTIYIKVRIETWARQFLFFIYLLNIFEKFLSFGEREFILLLSGWTTIILARPRFLILWATLKWGPFRVLKANSYNIFNFLWIIDSRPWKVFTKVFMLSFNSKRIHFRWVYFWNAITKFQI